MTREELIQSFENSINFYEGQLCFIDRELKWIKEQIKLDKEIGIDNSKMYAKMRSHNYRWRKHCKATLEQYKQLIKEL